MLCNYNLDKRTRQQPLRNNAACCIPLRDLRDLRYLRENIHIRVLNLLYKETPRSPADLADLRRQAMNNNFLREN